MITVCRHDAVPNMIASDIMLSYTKGSFTIVNMYVLVQRVLGGGGSEASVLFF